MSIRLVQPADQPALAALREALWPDEDPADLARTLEIYLADPVRYLALAAWGQDGAPIGFADAALRQDYVNGCETSPVAFLEGVYVIPASRGRGLARALVEAVATWGREMGCSELASDALLDNLDSHRMHRAVGFEETERVVYFRRRLGV